MTSSYEEDVDVVNMEIANQTLMNKIENEIQTWHWYDEKLFRLYYFTDKSLRKIAKETKISLTSIYNSCKNYRQIIEDKFGEDIEDFFNKEMGSYDSPKLKTKTKVPAFQLKRQLRLKVPTNIYKCSTFTA